MTDHNQVLFQYHAPIDFLYSLYALGTESLFLGMISDYNLEPKEELTTSLTLLKKDLSPFMLNEMQHFYNLSGIGYIFCQYILRYPEITEIPSLIQKLQTDDPFDFLYFLLKDVCKNIIPEQDTDEYHDVKDNTALMLDYVNQTEFQDVFRKEKVIECIHNPEETIQRLSFLLLNYYKKAYRKVEQTIEEYVNEQLEKYQALFAEDPQRFMGEYLNISSFDAYSHSTIYLSFFKYISWHHYTAYRMDSNDWFVLGIYTDLMYADKLSFERYAAFFKTLSDPNRIAILSLLQERPWYGQELAEQLNITPATISYHMSFLQKAGIVTFSRLDNRSYYCMNNIGLVKTLEDFIRIYQDS